VQHKSKKYKRQVHTIKTYKNRELQNRQQENITAIYTPPPPPQPFYGPFYWTTGVSRCQKRTSGVDFMVQGKINRGRHTDHPDGRHSIRTNQCPSPPSSNIHTHTRRKLRNQ